MPAIDDSTTMTLSLRPELAAALEASASRRGSSPSQLAEEAITRLLDHEEWATAAILAGVRQADAGELASDDEIDAAFDLDRVR